MVSSGSQTSAISPPTARAEPDPDAVPGRQPRHHEQAHAPRHRDIHHRRVIQPPVGVSHLLRAHAHALVGDLQQDPPLLSRWPATVTAVSAAENEVAFSTSSAVRCTTSLTAAAHGDARLGVQRHALIPLDLGDGGAEHVHQRDRPIPPPGEVLAGEHQQVLRVAAQPGGQVVHLEQASQPLGILLALLQPVDEPDLPFHQGLAAAGQVHEHGVDVPAQSRLVGGQPDRLLVDLVKGPRDLPDLVGGIHIDRLNIQ